MKRPTQEQIDALTRQLVDQGKLVEAGWVSFRAFVIPLEAGEDQVRDTRAAFFAGAQHLWGSIMTMLEPDSEPTDTDMKRMDNIATELDAYYRELKKKLDARPMQ